MRWLCFLRGHPARLDSKTPTRHVAGGVVRFETSLLIRTVANDTQVLPGGSC